MSSLKKGVLLLVASLGAISLGTVAIAASFPSAAGAAGGKAIVTLGKQAELFARGAAVGVPVHITCDAPSVPTGQSLSQNVSVQLSEVVAPLRQSADAVAEGLAKDDTSAAQLGKWEDTFTRGMERMRRLVCAYYDGFSFGRFVKQYPHLKDRVTDVLIGDVFDDKVDVLWPLMDAMQSTR